ncbi:MAG: bifunctional YncE family protein/alkaline phosphatase family protein [Candidatus Baltobacteraceae bacterium]
MLHRALAALALTGLCAVAGAAVPAGTTLPSGWRIEPPSAAVVETGTMPQGIALSPNASKLAVVESGYNPPALRILDAGTLASLAVIPLKGAFGQPVWQDDDHVWVAGANIDGAMLVDTISKSIGTTVSTGKSSWPAALALSPDKTSLAISDDLTNKITIVNPAMPQTRREFSVGSHPSGIVFSRDGKTVYVANRGESSLSVITLATGAVTTIAVGAHPVALALSNDASKLYVADSDDDGLTTVYLASGKVGTMLDLGLRAPHLSGYGASPNAIAVAPDGTLYVSCGAQNAVAVVKNNSVAARIPAGWYPSGVALASSTLYISDGKGEGTHPNPEYRPNARPGTGYVAATLDGSIRMVDLRRLSPNQDVVKDAEPTWNIPPKTVLRAGGPIKHVIYIIKENRSYDQVLGDLPQADGDPALVWFGQSVTPNQHAIARRFGIFDNAFTNAQVSADGHNWTDAAFANDYVERFWPADYGGRRDLYDFETEAGAALPHGGLLWDAAAAAHVSYRDYGEAVIYNQRAHALVSAARPSLRGHVDLRYRGWDLAYSDQARIDEWSREFESFAHSGNLPQLEIIYLPNDHTSGTQIGRPTPRAYVANNDYAVGRVVEAVSHSRFWRSTAIFALEDDAQNGPDHVSNQRSTFYIASAYARPGVYHAHYSTASVLHSIELILGLHPLSIYDMSALPMYAAFGLTPSRPPFNAIKPAVSLTETNQPTAYGARLSAKLNWSEPDAVDPHILNAILEHSVKPR